MNKLTYAEMLALAKQFNAEHKATKEKADKNETEVTNLKKK